VTAPHLGPSRTPRRDSRPESQARAPGDWSRQSRPLQPASTSEPVCRPRRYTSWPPERIVHLRGSAGSCGCRRRRSLDAGTRTDTEIRDTAARMSVYAFHAARPGRVRGARYGGRFDPLPQSGCGAVTYNFVVYYRRPHRRPHRTRASRGAGRRRVVADPRRRPPSAVPNRPGALGDVPRRRRDGHGSSNTILEHPLAAGCAGTSYPNTENAEAGQTMAWPEIDR
jgi:hypothetical protein